MRINLLVRNFLLLISSVLVFITHLNAQSDSSNRCKKYSVKIDLIPYYYDFFDTQKQIRIAAEVERIITKRSSVFLFADGGLFDDYTFFKYYDFFNQNNGFYYVKHVVKIKGFHLEPGYKYNFIQSVKNPNTAIFIGLTGDIHYYRKKFEGSNSQTEECVMGNYNQLTAGLGVHAGVKYGIGGHFFAEARTCFFIKLLRHALLEDIKPMNAQWTNSDYKWWWLTNFEIGYVF